MSNLLVNQYGKYKRIQLDASPYSCLLDTHIEITPHQENAFCSAVKALKTGGIILADEVGLGKTIEAGLVLKYMIDSGAKKIMLTMPASLRKQWEVEHINHLTHQECAVTLAQRRHREGCRGGEDHAVEHRIDQITYRTGQNQRQADKYAARGATLGACEVVDVVTQRTNHHHAEEAQHQLAPVDSATHFESHTECRAAVFRIRQVQNALEKRAGVDWLKKANGEPFCQLIESDTDENDTDIKQIFKA